MKFAYAYIILLLILALFGDFIAHDDGIIGWSAQQIDMANANFVGPFDAQNLSAKNMRHWLGTDGVGRDVLAGLIRGARIALGIGLGSMIFSLILGLPMGLAMGYLGNDSFKTTWWQLIIICLLGIYGLFLTVTLLQQMGADHISAWGMLARLGLYLVIVGVFIWFTGKVNHRLGKQITFPVDAFGLRLVEIFRSIPALFLLLAILSLTVQPGIVLIAFIIGLLRWPTIARYVRAEVWKVRQQDYIKSATSLGLSKWRIAWRHVLPNALSPVMVTIAFGIAGAVLLESSLSFLGLGLTVDQVSWGRLLSEARFRMDAWWLILFPGLAIFCTVYAFNLIGAHFSKRLSGQKK